MLWLDGRRSAERRVVENGQVLLNGAPGRRQIFGPGHAALTMGIRHDQAGIHGEALAADQAFRHAAPQDRLEQLAQQIGLPEPAVAGL